MRKSLRVSLDAPSVHMTFRTHKSYIYLVIWSIDGTMRLVTPEDARIRITSSLLLLVFVNPWILEILSSLEHGMTLCNPFTTAVVPPCLFHFAETRIRWDNNDTDVDVDGDACNVVPVLMHEGGTARRVHVLVKLRLYVWMIFSLTLHAFMRVRHSRITVVDRSIFLDDVAAIIMSHADVSQRRLVVSIQIRSWPFALRDQEMLTVGLHASRLTSSAW